MDLRKARKAIRETARCHKISEKQAVLEIEYAISEARRKVYEENNRDAIALWEQIPSAGGVPTAYELIAYLGEKVELHSDF